MVGQLITFRVTIVGLVLCLIYSYLNGIAVVFMVTSYGIYLITAISDVCIVWRKDLRRVWSLPYKMHTALLAQLSNSIPLMDATCRRSLSFTVDCPCSNCNLVSFVSRRAVNFGRMFSPTGCNVMFCCERYQQAVTVDNALSCSLSPNAIRSCCISQRLMIYELLFYVCWK